jgi:hypothetical protein
MSSSPAVGGVGRKMDRAVRQRHYARNHDRAVPAGAGGTPRVIWHAAAQTVHLPDRAPMIATEGIASA